MKNLDDAARAAAEEPGETRSPDELLHHYQVEKELAARLRHSTREERRSLYTLVYEELVHRVEARLSDRDAEHHAGTQIQLLNRYLNKDVVFMDVGAGDCSLALAVAERVRLVHAIEVSPAEVAQVPKHDNLQVHLSDGISIPVPPHSVTLAHSNQVLEHIHPDDALEHMRSVHEALASGGRFVCVTPNRLVGPADISRHFDSEPTGFHLREYTVTELARLMREAGFATEVWTTRKGVSVRVPSRLIRAVESVVDRLPRNWVWSLGRRLPLRVLLGSYVIGLKVSH